LELSDKLCFMKCFYNVSAPNFKVDQDVNGNTSYDVDGRSLLADSQPKSIGLVCQLVATWHCVYTQIDL